MARSKGKPDLRSPEDGRQISRNEILDVMADEGYSAAERKTGLKKVLTQVAKAQTENPGPDPAKLQSGIRDILHRQVSSRPEADDTL